MGEAPGSQGFDVEGPKAPEGSGDSASLVFGCAVHRQVKEQSVHHRLI